MATQKQIAQEDVKSFKIGTKVQQVHNGQMLNQIFKVTGHMLESIFPTVQITAKDGSSVASFPENLKRV